jgi:hypothetical protein
VALRLSTMNIIFASAVKSFEIYESSSANSWNCLVKVVNQTFARNHDVSQLAQQHKLRFTSTFTSRVSKGENSNVCRVLIHVTVLDRRLLGGRCNNL